MFQYGQLAGGLRLEHRHDDGSSAPMEPADRREPSDPERDWQRGHVFVCTRCNETVLVATDEPGPELTEAG
jgi:hypothetical protein